VIKIVVSLVLYFIAIFFLSKFSTSPCDIALSIIHILKEQSSEEDFSLPSLYSSLVLAYTNFIFRPSLGCFKSFLHDYLFTPLDALSMTHQNNGLLRP
jgi:hypothetical protein